MKRLLAALLLLALSLAPAAAQIPHVKHLSLHPPSATAPSAPAAPYPIHITNRLLHQPATQQAIQAYRAKKARGALSFSAQQAAQEMYEVDDTLTFKVRDIAAEDSVEAPAFVEHEFVLKAQAERFLLWVELDELDTQRVRPQDIEALSTALADETPAASINPEAGIIANDEQIFGEPPNVDGDGKTDVLLTNVRDLYEPIDNPGFVAGFVDPLDLFDDNANNRDVLYLDTRPALYEQRSGQVQYRGPRSVAATAAHEYQHLIHFNYDRDELTFVNEGLSEFAEIANGYPLRSPRYLSDSNEYNVPLLRWSGGAALDQLVDYQRAALFTNYIAARIGIMPTGRITRMEANGTAGYRPVLSDEDLDLRDLIFDFHTANFLNDTNVDPRFGYDDVRFQTVNARPSRTYDGRISSETAPTSLTVEPGGVQYLSWSNVRDFTLALDVSASRRDRLRARALLYNGGVADVRTLDMNAGEQRLAGSYDRVVVVLAHVAPDAGSVSAQYSASWAIEQTFAVDSTVYDPGQASTFFGSGGAEVLTRFERPAPEEAFLAGVSLPIYYFSQFSNYTPPPPAETAPRNFTLTIRDAAANGQPGDTLLALTQTDPRAYTPVTSDNLSFARLDLSAYEDRIGALPDTFFIGYRDAGQDTNSIVLAPASHEENLSYIGYGTNWVPFQDVELTDDTSLDSTIVPIRASFFTPKACPASNVELASFEAQFNNGSVALSWEIASQANVDVFEVRRSENNGQTFESVGSVNQSGSRRYNFTDSLKPPPAVPFDSLQYQLEYINDRCTSTSSLTTSLAPEQLALYGNGPNPFSAATTTTIRYGLTKRQHVKLTVYDALGRQVALLVDEQQDQGVKQVDFDPNGLSSGVYFYVLQTSAGRRTGKMMLVR